MRLLTVIVFLCAALTTNAQTVLSKIPNRGKSLSEFIPADYDTIMVAKGDLNKDLLPDIVLVLRANVEEDESATGDLDSVPARIIVILFQEANGLKLAAKSDQLILCKDCGGMMGDPFADVSIAKNVLTVSHYGGSSWRWSYDHKFRFQDNDFFLIGERSLSYHNIEQCEKLDEFAGTHLVDVNYVTGDFIEKKVSDEGCRLLINKKGKRTKAPLKRIGEYSIEN